MFTLSSDTPPGLRYETASEGGSVPGTPADTQNVPQQITSRGLSAASATARFLPVITASGVASQNDGLTANSSSWMDEFGYGSASIPVVPQRNPPGRSFNGGTEIVSNNGFYLGDPVIVDAQPFVSSAFDFGAPVDSSLGTFIHDPRLTERRLIQSAKTEALVVC